MGDQPPPGRGQPDPAAGRLQQRHLDLPLQRGQLLADRRGAVAGGLGHGRHRAAAGQLDQGPQLVQVHPGIVQHPRMLWPQMLRWTRTVVLASYWTHARPRPAVRRGVDALRPARRRPEHAPVRRPDAGRVGLDPDRAGGGRAAGDHPPAAAHDRLAGPARHDPARHRYRRPGPGLHRGHRPDPARHHRGDRVPRAARRRSCAQPPSLGPGLAGSGAPRRDRPDRAVAGRPGPGRDRLRGGGRGSAGRRTSSSPPGSVPRSRACRAWPSRSPSLRSWVRRWRPGRRSAGSPRSPGWSRSGSPCCCRCCRSARAAGAAPDAGRGLRDADGGGAGTGRHHRAGRCSASCPARCRWSASRSSWSPGSAHQRGPRPQAAPVVPVSTPGGLQECGAGAASSLGAMTSRPARAEIGVIGGSGFYAFFDDAGEVATVEIETPFGPPSAALTVGEVAGRAVAFLPRHGSGTPLPAAPGQLPGQPLGAAGGRRAPGARTVRGRLAATRARAGLAGGAGPGGRPHLGSGAHRVRRAGSGRARVLRRPVLPPRPGCRCRPGAASAGWPLADHGTLVVINGPRFSSRAESQLARGGRLVGRRA